MAPPRCYIHPKFGYFMSFYFFFNYSLDVFCCGQSLQYLSGSRSHVTQLSLIGETCHNGLSCSFSSSSYLPSSSSSLSSSSSSAENWAPEFFWQQIGSRKFGSLDYTFSRIYISMLPKGLQNYTKFALKICKNGLTPPPTTHPPIINFIKKQRFWSMMASLREREDFLSFGSSSIPVVTMFFLWSVRSPHSSPRSIYPDPI